MLSLQPNVRFQGHSRPRMVLPRSSGFDLLCKNPNGSWSNFVKWRAVQRSAVTQEPNFQAVETRVAPEHIAHAVLVEVACAHGLRAGRMRAHVIASSPSAVWTWLAVALKGNALVVWPLKLNVKVPDDPETVTCCASCVSYSSFPALADVGT